jgi:hypothetical protein
MQRNYFQDRLSSKGFARTSPARHYAGMVSLSDSQLKIVMDVAATIAPDRRPVFLERCGAMLKVRGIFTDADLRDIVRLATAGLVHAGAA